MTKTNTFNVKSVILSAVVMGMLLSIIVPSLASAQAPTEAGNANRDSAPAETRGSAPNLEDLRSQVAALQAQIEALRSAANGSSSDNGAPAETGRGNAPSFENGLPVLPEQASDRAKQVMQCLQLGRSLGLGAQSADVQQIQEFLKEKGFFTFPTATGYYGPVTQEAIEAFQASQGIVSTGSPETTGFGQVGPRTQAALAQASCLSEGQASGAEAEENEGVEDEEEVEETEEEEVEEEESEEEVEDESSETEEETEEV